MLDEFVTLNTVTLFLMPTVGSGTVTLDYCKVVSRAGYPNDRIQIVQGPPNQPIAWYARFPEGHSNVRVNAVWGYGSTIPADVWLAVQRESAAAVLAANTLSPLGQLVDWQDDDVREKYSGDLPGDAAGWCEYFNEVCESYRRPLTSRRRRQMPELY